jgi:hypothetical protein
MLKYNIVTLKVTLEKGGPPCSEQCSKCSILVSMKLLTNAVFWDVAVHTRRTRRHIPEDGILHSDRRENLKSYMKLLV